MSSISVRLDGEVDELLARLKQMSGIDKAGVMNAIAEGLRTSTVEKQVEAIYPGNKAGWQDAYKISGTEELN